MSILEPPHPDYMRLELVRDWSFEYRLHTYLPMVIDGIPCTNTNIVIQGSPKHNREQLDLASIVTIFKETFHRSPMTQEEADEARGFTLLIPEFRKFLAGEEFERKYPHLGLIQNFKKYDNGYYLEEIHAEYLVEPLDAIRHKALNGTESKGYNIFYFSMDTHSRIVNIFNIEKDISIQLDLFTTEGSNSL